MILYLVRHGIAADATPAMSDADRPLTAEGMRKFRRCVKGLKRLDPGITHVFSSPLLRARQTAEILIDVLSADVAMPIDLSISESLAPPGKRDLFLSELRSLPELKAVAAVGHEPILSQWLSILCFKGEQGAEMKKGAIAAVELDDNGGTLLWLMQPRHLRSLK